MPPVGPASLQPSQLCASGAAPFAAGWPSGAVANADTLLRLRISVHSVSATDAMACMPCTCRPFR